MTDHHNHDDRYPKKNADDGGCGCLLLILGIVVPSYYIYVQFFGPGFEGFFYWMWWLLTCAGTCGREYGGA